MSGHWRPCFCTASLRASPDQSQFFKGDSVSFSCGASAGWTVRRNTTEDKNQPCTQYGEHTDSACSLSRLFVQDSGTYWCEREGAISESVNITVKDKSVPISLKSSPPPPEWTSPLPPLPSPSSSPSSPSSSLSPVVVSAVVAPVLLVLLVLLVLVVVLLRRRREEGGASDTPPIRRPERVLSQTDPSLITRVCYHHIRDLEEDSAARIQAPAARRRLKKFITDQD